MEYKLHNGGGKLCCKGCSRQDNKLNTYDWLADIPGNAEVCDMVEIQFKNTRKGYYKNSNKISLEKGDVVAVEATPGHDIGVVTLTGRLVPLQMRKANIRPDAEIKRIYRKAKPVDIEKYEEAKNKEHDTMIRARQISKSLNLDMKIGDVEYQGDGNKAIFYYIADERVDFRQLIKVLAEAFRVRIEMKQIGARQEAGRIGGIGPCGRELCCATWMTSFISVSTSAARYQDISLNPQKLAGQCAKLKCCLNYEVDSYVEAQKRLPSKEIELLTKDNTYYFFKADILSNEITYSTDKAFPANVVTISGKRAFEIIGMNKRGNKPDSLIESEKKVEPKKATDLLEQESLTRFDRRKNGKDNEANNGNNNRNKKKKRNNNNGQSDRENPASSTANLQETANRENNGERGEQRPQQNAGNDQKQRNKGRNNNNRQERPQQGQQSAQGGRPQGQGERPQQGPNRDNSQQGQGERQQSNRPQGQGEQQRREPQQNQERQRQDRPQQGQDRQGDRQQRSGERSQQGANRDNPQQGRGERQQPNRPQGQGEQQRREPQQNQERQRPDRQQQGQERQGSRQQQGAGERQQQGPNRDNSQQRPNRDNSQRPDKSQNVDRQPRNNEKPDQQ